jgi:tripeptidyl-peptidase I
VAHGWYALAYTCAGCKPDIVTDELKAYIAPTSATLAAFQAFATANGLAISSLADTSEWIEFTTTVAHANTLFGADYQHYTHAASGATLTRTLAYSLPTELAGHVDTLTPATGFDIGLSLKPRSQSMSHTATPANCNVLSPNASITPKCLQVSIGYHLPPTALRLYRISTGYLRHPQSSAALHWL